MLNLQTDDDKDKSNGEESETPSSINEHKEQGYQNDENFNSNLKQSVELPLNNDNQVDLEIIETQKQKETLDTIYL